VSSPTAGSSFQTNTTFTAKASFADAGTADTHTCTITWGDGTSSTGTVSETGGAGTCTANHAYTTAGPYTMTFKVTDSGGASGTATVAVSAVAPPPLAVTPGANQTVNEGAATTYSLGSFSGGVGPYTVSVDWGDGSTPSSFTAAAGAISAAHTYANDRATAYSVTVKVTDSAGGSASGTFSVTVKNVAPAVSITTPTAGTIFKTATSFSLSASFSDAGKSDTHTCSINWGDGSSSAGTVSESSGTCTASHSYANVGNYTITVTVTDNGSAAGTATVAVSASKSGHTLFQPGGGAVTTLILAPFKAKAAAVKTKKHVVGVKKAKHHVAKATHGNAVALAQLRRVLRFDPRPTPRL
jgi:hypothetical protein